MKVKGLDGQIHTWQITTKNKYESPNKSEYHLEARALLKQLFPKFILLEEVFLPGCDLYADFYIPLVNIVVEVHGEQHYEYNEFFHGSKSNFLAGKQRDNNKRLWCELNNISYVELPHYESIKEWRERIVNRK